METKGAKKKQIKGRITKSRMIKDIKGWFTLEMKLQKRKESGKYCREGVRSGQDEKV